MTNNSLIIDSINKVFSYTQKKLSFIEENSFFMQQIDNIILITILGLLILSTFASSDLIGYVALITLFLTIIKLFIKKGEQLEMNPFEVLLLIYFLIVIVSLSGSTLFHLSLKGFLKTFTYMSFYFSSVQYYKNNLSKIPFTIFVIGLCAASQGLIGLFQNFGQVEEISTWQDVTNINPEDVMTRVYGTLTPLNPNLFGGYLVASLPCLLGNTILEILEKHYKRSIILLVLAGITSFALILSGCRGAYVGLLVITICLFAFLAKFIWANGKSLFKQIYIGVIGAIVAFSTCVVLFVSSIRTRVFSIFAMRNDSSTSFRLNVYQSALHMIKDNWLLGIGVGNQNFREIYGLYMRTGFDALSSYNIFLELAVESGIFSVVAFVAFLSILIYRSVKFIFECVSLRTSVLMAISLTSIIAIIVHGLVDTIFFRPQVQFIFWTMVAFASALLNPKNNDCCNGK